MWIAGWEKKKKGEGFSLNNSMSRSERETTYATAAIEAIQNDGRTDRSTPSLITYIKIVHSMFT